MPSDGMADRGGNDDPRYNEQNKDFEDELSDDENFLGGTSAEAVDMEDLARNAVNNLTAHSPEDAQSSQLESSSRLMSPPAQYDFFDNSLHSTQSPAADATQKANRGAVTPGGTHWVTKTGKIITIEEHEKNVKRAKSEGPGKKANADTTVTLRRRNDSYLPSSWRLSEESVGQPSSKLAEGKTYRSNCRLIEKFTKELQANGWVPQSQELREVMENVQKSMSVDDLETEREEYQDDKNAKSGSKGTEKKGAQGTKRKSVSVEETEGSAQESPYTPTTLSGRTSLGSQRRPGSSTNAARERARLESDAHYLTRVAHQDLGVTLTIQHFMNANRSRLETVHEDSITLSSLRSWVDLEVVNINAAQLNAFAWRCLIRALQAFYRSQQGDAEIAMMRPILRLMYVENLDLTHLSEGEVMWIIQAIEARVSSQAGSGTRDYDTEFPPRSEDLAAQASQETTNELRRIMKEFCEKNAEKQS